MNKLRFVGACVLSFGIAGCASNQKQSIENAYQRGVADAEKHSLKFFDEYEQGFCDAIILANKESLRQQFDSHLEKSTIDLALISPREELIKCTVERGTVEAQPVSPLDIGEHSI